MPNWTRLLLVLGALLWAGAATAQTTDDIIKRGKVIIAEDPTSGPFGITGPDGKPDGYDVDVAKLVAKYMGVELELVPVTSQNRIPYLLTGKVDMVISLFAVTPQRALQVDFSNPYAAPRTVITALKDKPIKSLDDLKGLTVGVPRGTIPDLYLTGKKIPGHTILRFDDEATSIQALQTGQVDALGSSNTALRVINRGEADPKFAAKFTLIENQFSIGVRHDADQLRRWLNVMIYAIKTNGELDAISMKWIGEPTGPLPTF
jgi:polar amino acid transport system substrate-binding protein